MKKAIYLLLTPAYASIGDQAIAWAEERWLAAQYPDHILCVLDEEQTLRCLPDILAESPPDTLFFLQGGGNLGTLYPAVEARRRQVIQVLGARPAVLFPQSVWFESEEAARQSAETYSRPNLTLFARERCSLALMERWYPRANVSLRPDIVCSLYPAVRRRDQPRTRVLVSLRADRESAFPRQRDALLRALRRAWPEAEEYKMYHGGTVGPDQREALVEQTVQTFHTARLIVTDRLHGVIFAAVTGTPCVALPNAYHKNRENYGTWLYGVNYIAFCPDANPEKVAALAQQVIAIAETEKTQLMKTGWEIHAAHESDPS